MDKMQAANILSSYGIDTNTVADMIYRSTVEGVSGANQNNGFGYYMSAVAELWNINGTVNNPYAKKRRITNRYRGYNVTFDMISSIVHQYPNGIPGSTPLFDDLLGVTGGTSYARSRGDSYQSSGDYIPSRKGKGGGGASDDLSLIIFLIAFFFCKIFLQIGWIASFVLGLIIAGVISVILSHRGR